MTDTAATLVRGGVALHVDDTHGTGLPVVFQHGLGGDARQTAEAFPVGAAFRRLTLECRGHGSSESGDFAGFSLTQFTDDVIALIETARLGPVIVGGISMGAAIALRAAVVRPDLVSGLVLARPAWITAAAPSNMQPNIEVARLITVHAPTQARAAFLASETGQRLAREAPDNLNSLIGFFDRPRGAETAALLAAIASDGPQVSTEQVAALDVPTLIIGTGKDLIHPLAHAEKLASLIRNARLTVITSKADDRARYIAEFQTALGAFLEEFV